MAKVDLSKYKSLWKTQKALDQETEKETREEILKYYGPKTKKPVGKITRKALADRVFSEYVRLYYADDYGYVRCITSGEKMYRTQAQCGHFISRAVEEYRYDINNCYPQSYKDNCILGGNYKVYTLKMVDMLGRDKVEEMLNFKGITNHNQVRYETYILARYKEIVEKKYIIYNHEHGIEKAEF